MLSIVFYYLMTANSSFNFSYCYAWLSAVIYDTHVSVMTIVAEYSVFSKFLILKSKVVKKYSALCINYYIDCSLLSCGLNIDTGYEQFRVDLFDALQEILIRRNIFVSFIISCNSCFVLY